MTSPSGTASTWSPVVNGLHIGCVVEVLGDGLARDVVSTGVHGRLGQLADYSPESAEVTIRMMGSSESVSVPVDSIRPATNLLQPGLGGDEDSFDAILGPLTDRGALGEEIAGCLSSKGFCVLKVIESSVDVAVMIQALRDADLRGEFGRLCEEVEEGYLGIGCAAKVRWFDPQSPDALQDRMLQRSDEQFSRIAEMVQPYCEDACGSAIFDRTPALVCLAMAEDEEDEYINPAASHSVLSEYYSAWSRGVLRLVQSFGPAPLLAKLQLRHDARVSGLSQDYRINASAGTIIILREDIFEYTYEEPPLASEAAWMTALLLREELQWSMEEGFQGDVELFDEGLAGPPPPNESQVAVMSIHLQAASNMVECAKEWAAYTSGCDGHWQMPIKRFDYAPYYALDVDDSEGKTFVKHFSVQEGIDLFDPKAFEISNAEAACMDPQCRQVLEVGACCMYHIGITKRMCNTTSRHCSVSVGCDKNEWVSSVPDAPQSVATNNQLAIGANRFNYVFNLKGASYVCDTACSSSLVATHYGKLALLETRWDPIEWHIAFGTNLTLTVFSFIHSCAAHMLSDSGRCLTFNASANGYNRGDGTGAMILKLGENKEDRLAFLRGTMAGQDGRSASMSAPNGPAQERCIWGAVREAQMTPPESTVWECHGTATALGDPIEVGAVRKVQIKMPRLEPLMVGSSKSNIGHLEGGAAMIAMVKCVVVVIKTKALPTLHTRTLNPHLEHAAFDAFFCSEAVGYKYECGHCQVSSFGVGGTNGHAIFWGRVSGEEGPRDHSKTLMRKLERTTAPLLTEGLDPRDWHNWGPDPNSRRDDKYMVFFEKGLLGETVARWEKQPRGLYILADFYAVASDRDGWSGERMNEGSAPGLFELDVEIPDSGALQFRILAEGDASRAIGPSEPGCTRRTAPILGPAASNVETWLARGRPREWIRIEFLVPEPGGRGEMAINWYPVEQD